MKDRVLATLADRNYVEQAKQVFASAFFKGGWKGDFCLLSHNIPKKELKWFKDRGIYILECAPLSKKTIGTREARHPAVLDKAYLFSEFFRQWKNIVFFEGDIIIRASLDRLENVKGLWATDVFDRITLNNQFTDNNKDLFEELKRNYNLDKRTFNTGMFAFSSDIISDNSFSELADLFAKYRTICKYGEEGIINMYFRGKWKKLPYVYNMWNHKISRQTGIKYHNIDGIILHFVMSKCMGILEKPWDKESRFYGEWNDNYSKADLINNITPQEKIKKWGLLKMWTYGAYLMFRKAVKSMYKAEKNCIKKFLYWVGGFFKRLSWMFFGAVRTIFFRISALFGVAGKKIKIHSPQLYHFLGGKN